MEGEKADLASANENYIQELSLARVQRQSLLSDSQDNARLLRDQDRRLTCTIQELDAARRRESTLRSVVLANAGGEKVSDRAMSSKFAVILQMIQNIALSPHLAPDQQPSASEANPLDAVNVYMGETWASLGIEDRVRRIMSSIFDIVRFHILTCPLFGVEGYKFYSDNKPDSGERAWAVSGGLKRFELMLERSEGMLGVVSYVWYGTHFFVYNLV